MDGTSRHKEPKPKKATGSTFAEAFAALSGKRGPIILTRRSRRTFITGHEPPNGAPDGRLCCIRRARTMLAASRPQG